MPDTTNGDGSAYNFDRKLDRINDRPASMSELMRDFIRTTREGHQMFMEEVHSLIDLQKEQRIDIMALFEGNKHVRIMLEGPYDDPM